MVPEWRWTMYVQYLHDFLFLFLPTLFAWEVCFLGGVERWRPSWSCRVLREKQCKHKLAHLITQKCRAMRSFESTYGAPHAWNSLHNPDMSTVLLISLPKHKHHFFSSLCNLPSGWMRHFWSEYREIFRFGFIFYLPLSNSPALWLIFLVN